MIFNKFEKEGKSIKDDDFWIGFKDNFSFTIEEAKEFAPKILRLYREDTELIDMNLLVENKQDYDTGQEQREDVNNHHPTIPKSNTDATRIGDDDYKVYLPKDQEEQKKLGNVLREWSMPILDLTTKS